MLELSGIILRYKNVIWNNLVLVLLSVVWYNLVL